MSRLAVAVCLLLAPAARADDDWVGADKALHFSVSAALAGGGYAAAAAWSDAGVDRLATGASVSLLAGIGKELWDVTGHGQGSLKDLTWDLLGAVVGLALSWAIDTYLVPLFSRTAGVAEPSARALR